MGGVHGSGSDFPQMCERVDDSDVGTGSTTHCEEGPYKVLVVWFHADVRHIDGFRTRRRHITGGARHVQVVNRVATTDVVHHFAFSCSFSQGRFGKDDE